VEQLQKTHDHSVVGLLYFIARQTEHHQTLLQAVSAVDLLQEFQLLCGHEPGHIVLKGVIKKQQYLPGMLVPRINARAMTLLSISTEKGLKKKQTRPLPQP